MAHVDLRSAELRGGALSAPDLVVIGAGWAGLAAAVHATLAGLRVHVLESAPAGGGRAREARLDFGAGVVAVDAGQHLLMGAYRECLQLASIVRAAHAPSPFERAPLALRDTAGLRLEVRAHRAPWHLLAALVAARGLSPQERWSMLRLFAALHARGWRTPPGETVAGLLARQRQPRRLVERLWAPLCIGAMNTPPEAACAAAFAAVLRDTLGSTREASDFVLARTTLDDAITRPAIAWLQARGAELSFGATVRSLAFADGRWLVDAGSRTASATQVIVATPPVGAARLLEPLVARAAVLADFVYEPIVTVHLAWPRDLPLPLPRWILLHDDGKRAWGQWLFDRGCIGAQRIACVVVSAGSRLDGQARESIGEAIAHQVARQLELPLPQGHRTVIDRRATIRCTPHRPRVAFDAFGDELPGLWLAGDWVDDEYPATLETAVRSGRRAATAAVAAAKAPNREAAPAAVARTQGT